MEVGEIIRFSIGDFKIIEKFFKTKGSKNQKMVAKEAPNTERGTFFFIVTDSGHNKYWVKENIPIRKKNTIEEWSRYNKFKYFKKYKNNDVLSTVIFLDKNENCILMEYLEGFLNINKLKINSKYKNRISKMLYDFVKNAKLVEYDLNVNNIMVKIDGCVNIKLIDFDVAPGRNLRREADRLIGGLNYEG